MLEFLKSLWSSLLFVGKLIGNERGEIGDEDPDAGNEADAGAGDKNDETAAAEDAGRGAAAANDGKTEKPDWRVEKYGPDWENNVQYWKDNSSYAWEQYKGEKQKRQKGVPLEELGAKDNQGKPAAQANGNGNGAAKDTTADGKPKFEDVDQLLEHINKQNREFFESQFSEKLTERERESNFRNSMQKARRENQGDPDNGIPSFADIEQDVLIPLVESNPKVLALLKELPGDPAENAYTLGILVKAKNINGLQSLFQRQGREQLVDKIKNAGKEAVRVRGGRSGPTSAELTADDIWKMSKEDFDKHVAKQTGRV